jgi:cytochrome c6
MRRSSWPVAAIAAVSLALASGCGGDDEPGEPVDTGASGGQSGQAAPQTETQQQASAGKETFANTCGGCHTLSDAGTNGEVGPNLDELQPSAQQVRSAIRRGPGAMPENLLQGADAQAVADYVSESAGG